MRLLAFTLALLAITILACTRAPLVRPTASPIPVSHTDAFAYCRAVGTIDAPDARWVGDKVPQAVARGLRRAVEAPPDSPLDMFINSSSWRCMSGKVYACNVGANLPCTEHADLRQTPNTGMLNYCRDNPNTDVIPAVAAGRATIYLWRCTLGTPAVVRQITRADERGFIASIWYEITPG